MKEKFWTVRDGQIGTAHVNRDGEVVDFRPASRFDGRDEKIVVYPPKGQEGQVKSLIIRATGVQTIIASRDGWMKGKQAVQMVYRGLFQGVEISARGPMKIVWYDPAAREAYETAQAARDAMRADVKAKAIAFVSAITVADFVAMVSPKEAQSKAFKDKSAFEIAARRIITSFVNDKFVDEEAGISKNDIYDWTWREVVRKASEISRYGARGAVMAAEEKRRAKRKEAWMAKKG